MINLTNTELEEKINDYTEEQISTDLTRSIQQLDKLSKLKERNNSESVVFGEQLTLNADMNNIYKSYTELGELNFGDIELIVSRETYKTIVDENFVYYSDRKEILINYLSNKTNKPQE